MFKMKNFNLLLIFFVLFSSCSEYNKVLNKGTVSEQYAMATQLYEVQEYDKALKLLELITPYYKGKPQMERIQYMVSDSYFKIEDYFNSAYYFERFAANYPKSSKREEAEFNSAKSHYLASPKYSVDQTETREALDSFQRYIDRYPDSERLPEANRLVKELQLKLEKKYFEIAKQYYDIGYYTAAIAALDNLMSEYLGTSYKEPALYYKFLSSYEIAMRSSEQKKIERIDNAFKAYNKLKKSYPASEYLQGLDIVLEELKEEKTTFNSQLK